jgi:hypothetical protein
MSPDSATIQWLVVACTVFQTVVAVTQTAARPRGESRPENRALDYPIKVGFLAAANGLALFLVAPRVRDLAADEQATTPMEVLGVIVVLVALCLPAHSVGANTRAIFVEGVGVGQASLYTLAAAAGIGIAIGTLSLPAMEGMDYWVPLGLCGGGFLSGLYYQKLLE